jgi:hypothetical protein
MCQTPNEGIMATTRDDLAAPVLTELVRREAVIAARAKPPAWKKWEARPDADDREFGPRYSPSWFGYAGDTEARRVRLLRTVYRLAEAGLVTVVKSEGGRLERLRLTDAGRAAVAESGCWSSGCAGRVPG